MTTETSGEITLTHVCAECGHVNEGPTEYCLYCGAPLGVRGSSVRDLTDAADSRDSWRVFGIDSPYVGRENEVETVLNAIREAVRNNSAVLVHAVGEEGTGKTRLLDIVNERVVDEYADVLMPKSHAHLGSLQPYDPFVQLLRDRFYVPKGASLREYRSRIEDGIRALVGGDAGADVARQIGAMLGALDPQAGASGRGTRDEVERAWRRALVQLFRADATRNPLILAFDDLDRMGGEAADLIRDLLPALSDVPVVFVVTSGPEFDAAVLTGDSDPSIASRVDLSPLADEQIEDLAGKLLGRVRDLPPALVERVVTGALGNPLAAEEIIRILIREGVVDTRGNEWTVDEAALGDVSLPSEVEAVVRARIERLSDDERELLADAAIIGNTFWVDALVVLDRARSSDELTDPDDPERVEAIRARLNALTRRDILRQHPHSRLRGEEEYGFKHWIEQRLFADHHPAGRARDTHRLIAQWLQVRSEQDPEVFLVAIARHHELGGIAGRAAEYFTRAGRLCRRRYVNDRALDYFERALAHLDERDFVARVTVLEELGAVYALRGNYDEAIKAFETMADAAWRLGSRHHMGVAFDRLGRAHRSRGDYDVARKHLDRAENTFRQTGDQAGLASTLDDIGRIHWIRGEYDKAQARYDRALSIRRELGDSRALALSLSHVGTLLAHRGQFKNALAHFREALDLRRKSGDLQGIAESLNTIGVIFNERGDNESAARIWREALDVARDAGDRSMEAVLLNNLGEIEIALGDLRGAEDHLKEACDIAEAVGDRRVVFDAIRNLGVLQARKGSLNLAIDHVEEALDMAKALRSRVMEGVALRTLGELHGQTVYDDSEDKGADLAEAAFRSSIEIFRSLGSEAELGRAYHAYGTFLVEQRLLVQGKKHLEMAREIFQRLEMRRILAQTEETIHDL